ncbi:MAG TPA: arsenate reductase ArsC [Saprospiraceae bacterium]|nr:arsenate reductase ArsC [Saprospiraceae bacterium]
MKTILFVCIENSNRSQMAQAFANLLGRKDLIAYSAGSAPSGIINPKAIAAMKELGYDLTTHASKSLTEIPDITYDAVITMGCGDACPWVKAKFREDWEIPDPRNMNEKEFRKVRDEIRSRVDSLLRNIGHDKLRPYL